MDTLENKAIYTESPKLFNSPLELGIRCLIILSHLKTASDIERLMYFDHLALNTHDIDGPESLHAPIPHRGVQIYARKEILQKGITILLSKELITVLPTDKGLLYEANNIGRKFLEFFSTPYFKELETRVQWVVKQFELFSSQELNELIDKNIDKWGGEFLTVPIIE